MNLPYSEQLDIGHFGRFFDNTSECYKFFWFKAILSKISEGKTEYTYEELVDEMIAEAWYMVSEYHLNLGPRDNLEQTVKRMNACVLSAAMVLSGVTIIPPATVSAAANNEINYALSGTATVSDQETNYCHTGSKHHLCHNLRA